jgi:hydrogenase expression/formation protein HypC
MCLAVPGRIVSIAEGDDLLRMGRVDFEGLVKEVSLATVPDAGIGDYVIVHVGFAISKLNEEEALKTLALIREALEAGESS